MPFLDFFRNFFGKGSSAQEPPPYRFEDDQRYRDSFRNPIWQNDDDEDDVSDFSNRFPRSRYQFRIFSDPFEMTRFFETQIDDLMRSFIGFGNGTYGNDVFSNALPMPDGTPKGPRDEVLKPDSKFMIDDFMSTPSKSGKIESFGQPAYEMPSSNDQKQDIDLDGKIDSSEVAKLWKSPPTQPQQSVKSFAKSTSMQTVQRADGSIEHRRTVRDSEGNEETTITRRIGDKMHTIVTKKAKDGTEMKTEDIVNMDENELKGFDDKWKQTQIISKEDQGDSFPWHKFFGPNPKL